MAGAGSVTTRRPSLPFAVGTAQVVVGLTVLAAVLRVLGIDAKGFWQDEAYTVADVTRSFGGMLDSVTDIETTPPLYFSVAWLWAKIFGTGEVGLRSLSVLLGSAAVPVAYLAAKELVSRRGGLVTALLVAVNPMLVWYGQEARSYSLVVLLTTASLLFFARALHTSGEQLPREVLWWALASGAALATHYFAVFVVVPEALWLLRANRSSRALRTAVVMLAVGTAVLLTYGVAIQAGEGRGGWIDDLALFDRIVQIPGIFLVGFEAPSPLLLAAIAAACAAVGIWLAATRATPAERGAAILVGGLAVIAVGTPVLMALAGKDYLLYRNVIPGLVPVLIVLATGFTARRAGIAGAAALGLLCAISVGVVLATADEPKFRKEAWREVAESLGPAPGGRAIVISPGPPAEAPLRVYLPGTTRVPSGGTATVREIAVVGVAYRAPGSTSKPRTPRPTSAPPPPARGFRLAGREDGEHFTAFTYRAARPLVVRPRELAASRIGSRAVFVFAQPR